MSLNALIQAFSSTKYEVLATARFSLHDTYIGHEVVLLSICSSVCFIAYFLNVLLCIFNDFCCVVLWGLRIIVVYSCHVFFTSLSRKKNHYISNVALSHDLIIHSLFLNILLVQLLLSYSAVLSVSVCGHHFKPENFILSSYALEWWLRYVVSSFLIFPSRFFRFTDLPTYYLKIVIFEWNGQRVCPDYLTFNIMFGVSN